MSTTVEKLATTITGCCGGSSGGCGPQTGPDAGTGVTPREIGIEFSYLDLNTCERCVSTGDTLDEALAVLAPAFRALGVTTRVNKVNIISRELAEQYRFVSSPTIRVNGVDICAELTESHCGDCSDLSGCSTDCRVFVHQGREYEQPPVGMIVDGILRVLYGPPAVADHEPYELPGNLAGYFNGSHAAPSAVARVAVTTAADSGCNCGTGSGCC